MCPNRGCFAISLAAKLLITEVDRTEHKLQNAKLSHQFGAVCQRAAQFSTLTAESAYWCLNERFF
jgi:hypothetical protein